MGGQGQFGKNLHFEYFFWDTSLMPFIVLYNDVEGIKIITDISPFPAVWMNDGYGVQGCHGQKLSQLY